jgi:thiol-disulfide isomerase/thioredoxin
MATSACQHPGEPSNQTMPQHTQSSPSRRHFAVAASVACAAIVLPVFTPPAFAAETAGPQPRPWPKNQTTPPLTLPGYASPPWSLAAAKGQVVLLNFWASWCEPCRTELPSLELLAQRHEADRMVVMAVNYRETDAAIGRFMDRTPITLPMLRDADGAAALAWQVRIFPTTVAVGRDGRAAFSIVGEVDWSGQAARQWIAALL